MRRAIQFIVLGAALFAVLQLVSPGAARRDGAAGNDEKALAQAATALDLGARDAVIARRLQRNADFLCLEDAAPTGMADSDLVVQRRLASRLRLAIEDGARAAEPSDDELRAWIAAHPQQFAAPARAQVTQIFFSRGRRGAALDADARAAAAALRAGAAVAGDPLPLPSALPSLTAVELAAMLGDDVSAVAFALPLGTWSAPVASPYGVHLLRVEARAPAHAPELAAVRAAVREAVLAARADAAVAAAVRELRGGG